MVSCHSARRFRRRATGFVPSLEPRSCRCFYTAKGTRLRRFSQRDTCPSVAHTAPASCAPCPRSCCASGRTPIQKVSICHPMGHSVQDLCPLRRPSDGPSSTSLAEVCRPEAMMRQLDVSLRWALLSMWPMICHPLFGRAFTTTRRTRPALPERSRWRGRCWPWEWILCADLAKRCAQRMGSKSSLASEDASRHLLRVLGEVLLSPRVKLGKSVWDAQ